MKFTNSLDLTNTIAKAISEQANSIASLTRTVQYSNSLTEHFSAIRTVVDEFENMCLWQNTLTSFFDSPIWKEYDQMEFSTYEDAEEFLYNQTGVWPDEWMPIGEFIELLRFYIQWDSPYHGGIYND